MPDMHHVFISYSSKDRAIARIIEEELARCGFDVWRDEAGLRAGAKINEAIKHRLDQALVTVVLWSGNSLKSDWVLSEADLARKAGKLVPALIEDCEPPLPHTQIHAANLVGWIGDTNDPRWIRFVEAIRQQKDLQERARGRIPTPVEPPESAARRWRNRAIIGALLAVVSIVVLPPACRARKVPELPAAVVVRNPKPFFPFKDCADCPLMARLPGGPFIMGSPDSEPDRESDEGPQLPVSVASFAIGLSEVTNEQWNVCVAQRACKPVAARNELDTEPARPVVNVSWSDAQAYVEWLAKRTGASYRLLTEREWEYAARAGETRARSFGEDISRVCRYENVADETLRRSNAQFADIFPCNDGVARTAPTRSYQPNAFGIYDMEGNVSEWVADCWSQDLERAPQSPTLMCDERVIRGGHWGLSPRHLRVANRMKNTADTALGSVGFRVAREF